MSWTACAQDEAMAHLGDDEGFEILVNGIPLTFRDVKETAARVLKSRWPNDRVSIIDRATGSEITFMADGRTC
jgi:hypothetical protein